MKITEIKETGEGYNIYCHPFNDPVVELSIDQQRQCCEEFGYFMSEDNLEEFIGAELENVSIVDKELRHYEDRYYEGDVMFVNISTSKGMLQFVAYNYHNGYYGHEAKVIVSALLNDLEYRVVL